VIEVGDYVRFSPRRIGPLIEVGVVIQVDDFGVLQVEPKSFELDSWKSAVSSYQRYQKDVIKLTESEVVMYLLEK
jgi:hypothetical protein